MRRGCNPSHGVSHHGCIGHCRRNLSGCNRDHSSLDLPLERLDLADFFSPAASSFGAAAVRFDLVALAPRSGSALLALPGLAVLAVTPLRPLASALAGRSFSLSLSLARPFLPLSSAAPPWPAAVS